MATTTTKLCRVCERELERAMFTKSVTSCDDCFGNVRRCGDCNLVKPLAEFHRSSRDKQGCVSICRECTRARGHQGVKTCHTCGVTLPAIDFASNAKDCPECYEKKRRCTTCKQVFPLEEFHRTASGSGFRRVCRQCVNQKQNDEYHSRPRPCKYCGKIQTSFPLNSQICTECYGKVRRCPSCDTVKDVSCFGKDASNPSGLQGICRECVAINDRERRSVRLTTCLHCGEDKPRTEFQKDKKVCNACKLVDHQTCNICGIDQPLSEFPENDPKQALGKSKRCRNCLKTRQRSINSIPRTRYTAAKHIASRRGMAFDISFDDFSALIQHPCHYCGHPLNPTGSGLDRIDPTGGYTIDNVVPCCRPCNWTKSDFFTYEEMLVIGAAIGRVKDERASHESSPPDVDAVSSQ